MDADVDEGGAANWKMGGEQCSGLGGWSCRKAGMVVAEWHVNASVRCLDRRWGVDTVADGAGAWGRSPLLPRKQWGGGERNETKRRGKVGLSDLVYSEVKFERTCEIGVMHGWNGSDLQDFCDGTVFYLAFAWRGCGAAHLIFFERYTTCMRADRESLAKWLDEGIEFEAKDSRKSEGERETKRGQGGKDIGLSELVTLYSRRLEVSE